MLSGCTAVFVAWAMQAMPVGGDALHCSDAGRIPPLLLAAYGGCLTTRHASRLAFQKRRRSMGATDVICELGTSVNELFDT